MESGKANSSAKSGVICAMFCMVAGISYGMLASTGIPITSFGLGLLIFGSTLGWFGIGFSILLLLKKRFKHALIVFITTNLIAMGLTFFAIQNCPLHYCGLQLKAVEDLSR